MCKVRATMATDRVGLAVQILDAVQVTAPVDAFVLASRYGIELRAMRGPTPAAVGGDFILFDVGAYWRDVHGEIARKFARRMLLDRRMGASPRVSLALAKELLLPRTTFEHDARSLCFDVEEIGALHRHAPIEWIEERLRSLKSQRLRTIKNDRRATANRQDLPVFSA